MAYLTAMTARETSLQCSQLLPRDAVIRHLIRKAQKPPAAFCYSVPVFAKWRTLKTNLVHVAIKRGLNIIVYTERGLKILGWPAYGAFSAGYASWD